MNKKKVIKKIARSPDSDNIPKNQKAVEKIKREVQKRAKLKKAQKEGEIPSMEEELFGNKEMDI